MKYTLVIQYLDRGEEGIAQLLKDSDDVINEVEACGEMLRNGLMGEEDYKVQLNIMTGDYGYLVTIFDVLQAYKETEEDKAYSNLRVEAETGGKKITADALKVEAHRAVNLIIRTRNVYQSYVSRCEKNIITIQSQLNKLGRWHPLEEAK